MANQSLPIAGPTQSFAPFKRNGTVISSANTNSLQSMQDIQQFINNNVTGQSIANPSDLSKNVPIPEIDTGTFDFSTSFTNPVINEQINIPDSFQAEDLEQDNFDFSLFETPEPTANSFLDSIRPFLTELSQQFGVPQAEQQEDVLTERLGEQIDRLAQAGARQTELETEAGVPQNIEQLQELNRQIAQEIGALGLGQANIEDRVVPRNIMLGEQAALQRQSVARIGALTATAQALQGNIALARDTIDRTIQAEFAPVETEIEKIKTFLQLNRDKMTRAERRRAEALQLSLAERERQLNDAKDQRSQILELGVQAAQAGADNQVLGNIFNAGSVEEAISLAKPFLGSSVTPIKLGEGEILIDPTTGNIIAEGRPKAPEELTIKDRFNLEQDITKSFENWAKDARAAQQQIDVITTGGAEAALRDTLSADDPNASLNAASQAVLVAFQKLLDPTSVVRESEYARSGNGLSLAGRIEGKWAQLTRGGAGVSAEDLNEFVNLAEQFYKNYNDTLVDLMLRTKTTSDKYGLDINTILRPSDLELLDNYYENQILDFIQKNPNQQSNIESLIQENPNLSNEDILSILNPSLGFNQVGGDTNPASGYLNQFGQVTGEGSPLWQNGLDVDLQKGDIVTAPISGRIIFAGERGGFGNQIQIEGNDGRTYWLSHLDKINARVGDRVSLGQSIALGGNTGNVIPLNGGDGSHLDITVVDRNGQFIPPSQIRQLLS